MLFRSAMVGQGWGGSGPWTPDPCFVHRPGAGGAELDGAASGPPLSGLKLREAAEGEARGPRRGTCKAELDQGPRKVSLGSAYRECRWAEQRPSVRSGGCSPGGGSVAGEWWQDQA